MINILANYEIQIRLIVYLALLVIMIFWEQLSPKRTPIISRFIHYSNNIFLLIFNNAIMRIFFPAVTISVSYISSEAKWGLLNLMNIPSWIEVILAIIILDLIIYFQHIIFHRVPLLWKLHLVHHADPDYDMTTGSRFHPIEILLSLAIKVISIMVLGIPVTAVVLFELILSSSAMFNHGNINLPKRLDTIIRWFIVTPDMHRIHHSQDYKELNQNFGFFLSGWDRVFRTYQDSPAIDHKDMLIGLAEYSDPRQIVWLSGMLMLPFRKKNLNSRTP